MSGLEYYSGSIINGSNLSSTASQVEFVGWFDTWIKIDTREEYRIIEKIFKKIGWKWTNGEDIDRVPFDLFSSGGDNLMLFNKRSRISSVKSELIPTPNIISLQKAIEILKQKGLIDQNFNSISNQNNMSGFNLIEAWRNLSASKEDKLMVKLGLENPIGVPTEAGKSLMMEMLYKKHRKELIEQVVTLDEENKKEEEQDKK